MHWDPSPAGNRRTLQDSLTQSCPQISNPNPPHQNLAKEFLKISRGYSWEKGRFQLKKPLMHQNRRISSLMWVTEIFLFISVPPFYLFIYKQNLLSCGLYPLVSNWMQAKREAAIKLATVLRNIINANAWKVGVALEYKLLSKAAFKDSLEEGETELIRGCLFLLKPFLPKYTLNYAYIRQDVVRIHMEEQLHGDSITEHFTSPIECNRNVSLIQPVGALSKPGTSKHRGKTPPQETKPTSMLSIHSRSKAKHNHGS